LITPRGTVSRVQVKWRSLAAAVTAALAGGLASCSSAAPTTAATGAAAVDRPGTTVFPSAARTPAPALRGRTLAGKNLALSDLTGAGVVVVNVWAAWCTECRAESRTLAALSRQFAARNVRFLGIDEQDSAERARRFSARAKWRYPSLVDPDGTLLSALTLLPSSGIPSTLVIDKHGLMAGRIVGAAKGAALSRLIVRVDSGN
jgi:peroxiredoxin